jgi:hypothetical protein
MPVNNLWHGLIVGIVLTLLLVLPAVIILSSVALAGGSY